jgi:hypothetical protein
MEKQKDNKFVWRVILALLLTLLTAYYQRKTGPTHPLDGTTTINGESITYQLLRTHGGEGDQPVEITLPDTTINAIVMFRRFKLNESWKAMKMIRQGNVYRAALPHQPPAGKLEFFIMADTGDQFFLIPEEQAVVTRFRGDVPWYVLTPHIFFMFFAMLLSTTAGLEALARGRRAYQIAVWTTAFLFVGGMILGPIVQKFAFDAYWTGFPFGNDLTDNKTLIALVAWGLALWRAKKDGKGRGWIIAAAIILIIVYSIPHSLLGSEYNYETMQVETGS